MLYENKLLLMWLKKLLSVLWCKKQVLNLDRKHEKNKLYLTLNFVYISFFLSHEQHICSIMTFKVKPYPFTTTLKLLYFSLFLLIKTVQKERKWKRMIDIWDSFPQFIPKQWYKFDDWSNTSFNPLSLIKILD